MISRYFWSGVVILLFSRLKLVNFSEFFVVGELYKVIFSHGMACQGIYQVSYKKGKGQVFDVINRMGLLVLGPVFDKPVFIERNVVDLEFFIGAVSFKGGISFPDLRFKSFCIQPVRFKGKNTVEERNLFVRFALEDKPAVGIGLADNLGDVLVLQVGLDLDNGANAVGCEDDEITFLKDNGAGVVVDQQVDLFGGFMFAPVAGRFDDEPGRYNVFFGEEPLDHIFENGFFIAAIFAPVDNQVTHIIFQRK